MNENKKGLLVKNTPDIFNDLYEDDEDGIFWTREFGDLVMKKEVVKNYSKNY